MKRLLPAVLLKVSTAVYVSIHVGERADFLWGNNGGTFFEINVRGFCVVNFAHRIAEAAVKSCRRRREKQSRRWPCLNRKQAENTGPVSTSGGAVCKQAERKQKIDRGVYLNRQLSSRKHVRDLVIMFSASAPYPFPYAATRVHAKTISVVRTSTVAAAPPKQSVKHSTQQQTESTNGRPNTKASCNLRNLKIPNIPASS